MRKLALISLLFTFLSVSLPAYAENLYYFPSGKVLLSDNYNGLSLVAIQDTSKNFHFLLNYAPAGTAAFTRLMDAASLSNMATLPKATVGVRCNSPVQVDTSGTQYFYYMTDAPTIPANSPIPINCLLTQVVF